MAQFSRDYPQVYRRDPGAHPRLAPSHSDEKISIEIHNRVLRAQCVYQKAVADAEAKMLGDIIKIFDHYKIQNKDIDIKEDIIIQ